MVEAQSGQATPVPVFYSYADEDQVWLKQLQDHMASLRRSKAITDSHRGMLAARAAGDDRSAVEAGSSRVATD